MIVILFFGALLRRARSSAAAGGGVIHVLSGAALFACALFAASSAHAQCSQASPCVTAPTNLGTLGGSGSYAAVGGINSDGSVVVGYSLITGNSAYHAFRWTTAGMVDLGTLGGNSSFASSTSGDGLVVVGQSNIGPGPTRAFRWTSAGMVNLGTLGGDESIANGTNSDGSVVVGYSYTIGDSAFHAFRWTTAGMVDLGTLGGNNSFAYGTNSDGSVVVGWSAATGNTSVHAFRWTTAGMVDLGTLGGNNSVANGTNSDGSVVVGNSQITGNFAYHAFRWTSAGMADLGTLGGTFAAAYGTNSDGSVVVGTSQITGNSAQHAFRWTSATGLKDLNTLLSNAGVNMAGITLVSASGVSSNGQFITGDGDFSGVDRAYLVRYYDGTPAGLTTPAAVQKSIDDLSDARLGVMAQQHGFASPLLGGNTPMGLSNEAGVFITAGSAAGGGFARYSFGTGLSLLAGVSYAEETYPDADLKHAGIGAVALQYIYGGSGWWQPFVEAGGWIAPNASLAFSRTYANGAGTATGTGHTHGDLSYLYARAGILLAVNRSDQLALSVEIGRERMSIDGYTEATLQNPFEAHVSAGTDTADLAKLRVQWSHRFTPALDTTLWVAGVHGFNRSSGLEATVMGIGTLLPTDLGALTWAEYGARVGYRLSDVTTLDVFANGVSGSGGIDTRIHTGVGLRFKF